MSAATTIFLNTPASGGRHGASFGWRLLFALVFVLGLCLAAAMPARAAGGSFGGGAGTPASPLVVQDALDLDAVRNCLSCSYVMDRNIDLSSLLGTLAAPTSYNGGLGWNRIGNGTGGALFTGTFNGAGYQITGLWISMPPLPSPRPSYVGLFGVVSGGTIQNLGVVITADGVSGFDSVGGLVGELGGSITNCYTSGGPVIGYDMYIGGLVGQQAAGSTITSSYATGNVTIGAGSGAGAIGGLVGFSSGTIVGSYASGNLINVGGNAGGLVGQQAGGSISNSYATGSVSSISDFAGGLVGQQTGGSISGSYASGSISSIGYAGGLVGYQSSTITNSYATGSASAPNHVGGLVGYQNSSITNTYATGRATGTILTGGLVGQQMAGNTLSASFFDVDTTGQAATNGVGSVVSAPGVTGEDTATMQTALPNIYSGASWNFSSTTPPIWYMPANAYPLLDWQAEPLVVTISGSYTYNGSPVTPATPVVTWEGNVLTLGTDYTLTPYSNNLNAGTATIKAIGAGTYAGYSGIGTFTLNPEPLTITPDSGQTKVYGTTDPALTYTMTAGTLYGSATLSSVLSGALARNAGEDVGDYAITQGTLAASDTNYTIDFTTGVDFSITPAAGTFPTPAPVLDTTYTPTLTLASLTLPTGYAWVTPTTPLNAGAGQSFAATYTDPSGNYLPVSGTVTVDVAKASEPFPAVAAINTIYTPTLTLASLTLPTGYAWVTPTTPLAAGAGQSFTATYTDPSGNYLPVTGNVTVNVAMATEPFPGVVPINVTYSSGLTLAGVSLPAHYAWNAPSTAVSAGAGQSFTATYTDPSGYYSPVSGAVTVNVAKAVGTFTAVAPISVTYSSGLTLAGVSLPTGYAWVTPTTALNAGTQTYAATYTDPSGNYNAASGTITVNVAKAAGVFPTPAPTLSVTYSSGLTLAGVSLPAGYAWDAPSTTVLSVGSGQTFAVTYTNPDGDYTAVDGTLTLNVLAATTTVAAAAIPTLSPAALVLLAAALGWLAVLKRRRG